LLKIGYNNDNELSFDFEYNLQFIKEINIHRIDELRLEYINNKRKIGKLIKYKDEIHNISDWAKKTNLNRMTLGYRLNKGCSMEEALTPITNLYNVHIINYKDKNYSQRELADFLNIPEAYLCVGLKDNLSIDEITKKYSKRIIKKIHSIEYNGNYYNKKELCTILSIPWTSFGRYLERYNDIYYIAEHYGKYKQ